eukprot:4401313-Prymnesium_polylepis.2
MQREREVHAGHVGRKRAHLADNPDGGEGDACGAHVPDLLEPAACANDGAVVVQRLAHPPGAQGPEHRLRMGFNGCESDSRGVESRQRT